MVYSIGKQINKCNLVLTKYNSLYINLLKTLTLLKRKEFSIILSGGEVRPKAEKKIVTSPIFLAKVVIDMPKGTLDSSPGVQDVFELL